MFGLLGAAGGSPPSLSAVSRTAGLSHRATGLLLLAVAAGWAALSCGGNLALLIVGILLVDAGIQGVHVLNQGRIYAFPPEIRSRVTTAYMTSFFLGVLSAVESP